MSHALKIEDLDLNQKDADKIEAILNDFLINLNFSEDRIEKLECRSRDGFSPWSHNKGGLCAVAFHPQDSLPNGRLGFKNADETLKKYYEFDIEYFQKEHGLGDYDTWTDEQRESFYEYRSSNSEADILLSCDLMLTNKNSLNIRLCICVKDAPYHREYDDLIEFNVNFRKLSELNRSLNRILNNKDVKKFSNNLRDFY